MNNFASQSQSIRERCLVSHDVTNHWLRGPPHSLGLGPVRCSPSMQPAEDNQGFGTTQIRHQRFCKGESSIILFNAHMIDHIGKWPERTKFYALVVAWNLEPEPSPAADRDEQSRPYKPHTHTLTTVASAEYISGGS